MNGYFRLVNREGSSSLKLFPPTGEGKPVDVTDVLEYLTMKDYACDLPTLKRAVENVVKEEQEIRVGNETRFPERECYKLRVGPDKMQAFAKFYAASEGGENMTAEEMIKDLQLRGIKCGIRTEAIAGFFAKRNYLEEILVADEHTISFRLAAPNVAFLDYMTMAVLPEHLLAGEDMQTSDFFRAPIGTGPYKLESWDMGQAIVLAKNEAYFKGEPHIDRVIFKIVTDDNAKTLQMEAGELDLALLPPKAAQSFANREAYVCYHMQTSDYRGILFNFNNPYWQENRDIIPAICYAIDRQAIVDAVLLGQGMPAYGPLQRNVYNNEDVEHYDYNPEKAVEILESVGCVKGADGIYTRNGAPLSFVISVGAGDQVRVDMAQAAAQQIREIGIDCKVEIPTRVDWNGQMAYLIGWGSPFDADDHTYKVFGTGKGANYSGYSNEAVDRYLTQARGSDDPQVRSEAYARFQDELAKDPAYAFICYIDADYVADSSIQGISTETVMGHHGVGIFWNIAEWTK